MLACPNLAVPAQVMRHVVRVESSANPFAIGVVGGQLVRQPKTLEEALATTRMLETNGYNYSVGAAQVNRSNFRKYGLDSHEKAFDFCANLVAGSNILAGCYHSAKGDWGKAFSCYYSGNFVTGFRHGYVQKIYNSIASGQAVAQVGLSPVNPIPLRPAGVAPSAAPAPAPITPALTAASRIAMRVIPFSATAAVAAPTLPAGQVPSQAQALQTSMPPLGNSAPPDVSRSDVFVPQVRQSSSGNAPTMPAQTAVPDRPAGDGAFVF